MWKVIRLASGQYTCENDNGKRAGGIYSRRVLAERARIRLTEQDNHPRKKRGNQT